MRANKFEKIECDRGHMNEIRWEGNTKYRFESGMCAIWRLDDSSILPYRRRHECKENKNIVSQQTFAIA